MNEIKPFEGKNAGAVLREARLPRARRKPQDPILAHPE
jgi:hypothetical protein